MAILLILVVTLIIVDVISDTKYYTKFKGGD